MGDPPPYLPPRRPTSMPNMPKKRSSLPSIGATNSAAYENPPSFLPPRRPSCAQLRPPVSARTPPVSRSASQSIPRPMSLPNIPDTESKRSSEAGIRRSDFARQNRLSTQQTRSTANLPPQDPRLQAVRDGEQLRNELTPPSTRRPRVLRHSSLRIENRVWEDAEDLRPYSHPPARRPSRMYSTPTVPQTAHLLSPESDIRNNNPYKPPPLSFYEQALPLTAHELSPRPRASLTKLSSFDNLLTYREEKAQWKRDSSILQQRLDGKAFALNTDQEGLSDHGIDSPPSTAVNEKFEVVEAGADPPVSPAQKSKFRHFAGEVGFCFTIAMTQFLSEYLISGFAVELPRLFYVEFAIGPGSLGLFWPASLLSLILSATLLIFARLSDMYGGYIPFMFGATWLTIWTLGPAFVHSTLMLDISRAMQGLAIAAFMPSSFVMVSSVYDDGPRKNFVLGLYSGCAPLGFFAGFLAAGALPEAKTHWYFWIASALSFVTVISAYFSVPHDKTERKSLGLKMDWLGSFLITAGLVLLAYSLAVEPYANQFDHSRNGFSYPTVYGPFSAGIVCLLVAVWVEGWYASCPLLPFDFFKPRSVMAFCLAGLCFYASYGAWLYMSAEFFQSPTGTTSFHGLQGIHLALWYTPTALGGLVLCVIGGGLAHIVPLKLLLLISGLAWIGASLLLALCPLPLNYWAFVLPSMLCATLGIDVTFTVSLIFLAAVQPQKYQGLCGAVCSILVNLAMSFSLPISEIVQHRAETSVSLAGTEDSAAKMMSASNHMMNWGFQAAFLYGAASAGLGLVISVLFVHIPRSVTHERSTDEEQARDPSPSEASTLVEERRGGQGEEAQEEETPIQSAELER